MTENSVCSGSMRVMTANNDAQVRVFDIEKFACINQFSFDWSVNVSTLCRNHSVRSRFFFTMVLMFASFIYCCWQNTSVSPDGKLLAVLGDSADCLIADAQSGKVSPATLSPIKFVICRKYAKF